MGSNGFGPKLPLFFVFFSAISVSLSSFSGKVANERLIAQRYKPAVGRAYQPIVVDRTEEVNRLLKVISLDDFDIVSMIILTGLYYIYNKLK